MQAGTDGAYRDLQDLSNLLVGQIMTQLEKERFSMKFLQLPDSCAHLVETRILLFRCPSNFVQNFLFWNWPLPQHVESKVAGDAEQVSLA